MNEEMITKACQGDGLAISNNHALVTIHAPSDSVTTWWEVRSARGQLKRADKGYHALLMALKILAEAEGER